MLNLSNVLTGQLIKYSDLPTPHYFYFNRCYYLKHSKHSNFLPINLTKRRAEIVYHDDLVEPVEGTFIENIYSPNYNPVPTFRLTQGGSPLSIGSPEEIMLEIPKYRKKARQKVQFFLQCAGVGQYEAIYDSKGKFCYWIHRDR